MDVDFSLTSSSDIPLLWCTRPVEQNRSWLARLHKAGFDTIDLPFLSITAVENKRDIEQIKTRILHLDQYKIIIFVSQNAVSHGLDWIESYWPQCPVDISWYAVGTKTAGLLKAGLDKVFNEDIQVHAADSAMTSENLLSLPSLARVSGERICVMRGLGGRPKLMDALVERGAHVDLCELYERRIPAAAYQRFNDILQKQYACNFKLERNYIVVFSGETLNNFYTLLTRIETEDASSNLIEMFKQALSLFVPSERVAMQARELGFSQVLCAKNATEGAMLAEISKLS